MTARAGDWTGTEFWIRCPHCGDSKEHPDKAHFSVNVITRAFHCYRCGASGRLSSNDLYTLTGELPVPEARPLSQASDVDHWEDLLPHLRPGPGSSRKTVLPRWHITLKDGRLLDGFKIRDEAGELVGLHLRASWAKEMRTKGDRLFLYRGESLMDLTRAHRFLRLVEGPYDTQDPMDVGLMGNPSHKQVKRLRGFPIVLCPDGDVWAEPKKLRQYFNTVSPLWITGVEFIPDGLDPDEVPAEDREDVPLSVIDKILRRIR